MTKEVSVPATNCTEEVVCDSEMHSTMGQMGADGVMGKMGTMDNSGESTMGTSSNGGMTAGTIIHKRTTGFNRVQNKRLFPRSSHIPPSFKRPMAKRTGPSLLQIWTYARRNIVDSQQYKQIVHDFKVHLADITFQYDQHRKQFPARFSRFSQDEVRMNILDNERHYEVCRAQIHAWDALFHHWPSQFKRFIRDCDWQYQKIFPEVSPNGGCVIMSTTFFPYADCRWAELHDQYMKIIPPQFKAFFGVFMETSASY